MGKQKQRAKDTTQASGAGTGIAGSSTATVTGSPMSLPIIYSELRKSWPVPERFLGLKMEDLVKRTEFVKEVDSWLDGLGLAEDVSVDWNLYPNEKSWQVRKFVEQGGFINYCPNASCEDHTGLLYRQAQRAQQNAATQADQLASEEVQLAKPCNSNVVAETLLADVLEQKTKIKEQNEKIEEQNKKIEEQTTELQEIKRRVVELETQVTNLITGRGSNKTCPEAEADLEADRGIPFKHVPGGCVE